LSYQTQEELRELQPADGIAVEYLPLLRNARRRDAPRRRHQCGRCPARFEDER